MTQYLPSKRAKNTLAYFWMLTFMTFLRLCVAVKLNFQPYIQRYTSPNENFEYSYPLNGIKK